MTEWQPIETAPKDGCAILCGWKGDTGLVVLRWVESRDAWCEGYGGWGDGRYYGDETPTHWQPLPEPPK